MKKILSLSHLLHFYATQPSVSALTQLLQEGKTQQIYCKGLHASASTVVFAALTQKKLPTSPLIFILEDEESAGYFYHDLVQLLGEKDVFFFPSTYKRAVKYAQRDAANEILRTQTLHRLQQLCDHSHQKTATITYVVTYPDALCERVAPIHDLTHLTIELSTNQSYDLPDLEKKLLSIGFKRTDYVYEPGEFAVRGSILDVYSFSSEYPFRIDFFGDEVETIRTFEVQSQLSQKSLEHIQIVPDIEVNSEALVPVTQYFPSTTLLITRNIAQVLEQIEKTYREGFSRQAVVERNTDEDDFAFAYEEEKQTPINPLAPNKSSQEKLEREALLTSRSTFEQAIRALTSIETHPRMGALAHSVATIEFDTSPQPIYHKNFDLVTQSFQQYLQEGYTLYITADSQKQNERIAAILEEKNPSITFTPIEKTLHEGFCDNKAKVCIFTDHQLFDRYHKYNLKSEHTRDAKMALTLKELMQFQPGDYIVHINHGVGRFAGLVRMPGADGTMQEMIKLTYQNEDLVFVSIHSLHKLSKYKGKEGVPPKLSRLGTGAWEKLKERTKTKIKDIARDLIKLYSQRKEQLGFAFSPDTFLQQELEAGFTYEDTPDQLKVTQEVKNDMESQRPMDRLVCGDVGFGKTEIAVRAAMKAAADNKQVAVLVPTTVLALQHYKTFCKRLKNFPVKVDYLTRARTATQTKQLLADLAEGKVNIVVGTHKLIGKNVKFKDLGLLIIDEEQKFGVAVKEKLRQLKTNIDTLTMSATPIPRTLQFSLMGARDLSIISTPPPNRRPIQTEVHTFNHEVIADAINFEMSRNGQVFIVTHRIATLYQLQHLVHKYVPDARIVVGHGQMPPAELEKIIIDFSNYDYDVLISTTIVENGIDIPNANTIIIDAAHHFGLSDLHQMRGRVGRSDKKAFCYLLAPPLSHLNVESRRRLQAIEDFSDLGSGIHIAMQDLDIRGAGNLLGAEQSGFIADLGYETYQKILSEAIAELRNEENFMEESAQTQENNNAKRKTMSHADQFVAECNIECDLHAFFPETYVPGASERMLLYRELDSLQSDAQIDEFRKKMIDRFGAIPKEGEELLGIVPLRREAKKLGVERILLKQGRMTLYFVTQKDSPFYKSDIFNAIIKYASTHPSRCILQEKNGKPALKIQNVDSIAKAFHTIQEILASS